MSRSLSLPTTVRATGAAVGALLFAGGVAAPAAFAAGPVDPVNFAAQCDQPFVGVQPAQVGLTDNFPSHWPAGQSLAGAQIGVDVSLLGDSFTAQQIVGAAPGGSLEGTAKVRATLVGADGSQTPFTVPVTLVNSPITGVNTGDPVRVLGVGDVPATLTGALGNATVRYDGISLSLRAKDAEGVAIPGIGDAADSDGDAITYDVPCTGTAVNGPQLTFDTAPAPTLTPLPTPNPTPLPTPTPDPLPAPLTEGQRTTISAQCTLPQVGAIAVPIAVTTNVPATLPAGTLSPKAQLDVALPIGSAAGQLAAGGTFGAATPDTVSKAGLTLVQPTGQTLPLTAKPSVRQVPASAARIEATTTLPQVQYLPAGTGGTGRFTLDQLTLNVTARDAGGNVLPLGSTTDRDGSAASFDVPCSFPSTTIATTTVTSDKLGVTGSLGFASGSRAPLAGTATSAKRAGDGAFSADLQLDPAKARLRLSGGIPASATLRWAQVAPLTGKVTGGRFSGSTRASLQLSKVSILGVPVSVGSSCQTNAATFDLAGQLSPLSTGTISGAFAVSSVTGCGSLNAALSAALVSRRNAISLTLQP